MNSLLDERLAYIHQAELLREAETMRLARRAKRDGQGARLGHARWRALARRTWAAAVAAAHRLSRAAHARRRTSPTTGGLMGRKVES